MKKSKRAKIKPKIEVAGIDVGSKVSITYTHHRDGKRYTHKTRGQLLAVQGLGVVVPGVRLGSDGWLRG